MDITVYGAGQEVGRSCIEVSKDNRRFIFDAGLMLSNKDDGPLMPKEINDLNYIQNVFISHVHLDHAGYLPNLYAQGLRCPIYASHFTKKLLPLLLKDSWKIAMIDERAPGYRRFDMRKVLELTIEPKEDERGNSSFEIGGGVKAKMLNAGHIPGARAIYLDFGEESVLYTGDFTLTETRLVPSADIDNFPEADILITESTYGGREHPDRIEEEKKFIQAIRDTLDNDGAVLLPTFSIGRSQEMIMLLEEYGFTSEVPVYLDGMGKRVANEFKGDMDNPLLDEALRKVHQVEINEERLLTKGKKCIIVTTSGMLDGGPICQYIKLHYDSKVSSIFLTGYQAEATNGRRLLEQGDVNIDGLRYKIDCNVETFNFSSHAGFSEIKKVISKVNPKSVVLVHGDVEALNSLKEYVESLGLICYVPKNSDKIHIAKPPF